MLCVHRSLGPLDVMAAFIDCLPSAQALLDDLQLLKVASLELSPQLGGVMVVEVDAGLPINDYMRVETLAVVHRAVLRNLAVIAVDENSI